MDETTFTFTTQDPHLGALISQVILDFSQGKVPTSPPPLEPPPPASLTPETGVAQTMAALTNPPLTDPQRRILAALKDRTTPTLYNDLAGAAGITPGALGGALSGFARRRKTADTESSLISDTLGVQKTRRGFTYLLTPEGREAIDRLGLWDAVPNPQE